MKKIRLILFVTLVSLVATLNVNAKDKKDNVVKFMEYNILEGMKLDRDNNFTNFVEWIKKQNPDILAICECNHFTEESLKQLSKRYGHPYAILCKEKGYPVALTSKYPIKLKKRMLEGAPLWHGAIYAQIGDIDIAVLHLYPFGAFPKKGGVPKSGDTYRNNEVQYILDNTFNQKKKPANFIICGDFNSYSIVDKDNMSANTYFGTHDIVRNAGLFDVLNELNGKFYYTVPTEYDARPGNNRRRLDYVYFSKKLMKNAIKADVIYDEFTHKTSDHYPVVIEFKHNKKLLKTN